MTKSPRRWIGLAVLAILVQMAVISSFAGQDRWFWDPAVIGRDAVGVVNQTIYRTVQAFVPLD